MPTPLSLIFDIAATDRASAVFARVGAAAGAAGAESEAGMARVAAAGSKLALGFGVAAAAATVLSMKMAADFQTATNQLVTSAGETASNLELVRKGLLEMAGQVGVSATELAKGMYQVESAGFRGARGLDVMRAAAEGAKAEGASMETVANALTTVLNDYGNEIQNNAVKGTNFLIASVSLGKTRMEDFSGAISQVLPTAQALGISLQEVGGAMSTMTSEGISADVAATYLRQTITKLGGVMSNTAKNELTGLGLSAIDVQSKLGERGLAGTLTLITDAIQKKMGPAGIVYLDMLRKAGQNQQQFQTTLTSLPQAAQTAVGALGIVVGGTKTMMGALALTGAHMKTFKDDTLAIGDAMNKTGKDVNGWDVVQQSFNQRLSEFKAQVGAIAIELGTKLLPAASAVFKFMTDFLQNPNLASGKLRDWINSNLWSDATATTLRDRINVGIAHIFNGDPSASTSANIQAFSGKLRDQINASLFSDAGTTNLRDHINSGIAKTFNGNPNASTYSNIDSFSGKLRDRINAGIVGGNDKVRDGINGAIQKNIGTPATAFGAGISDAIDKSLQDAYKVVDADSAKIRDAVNNRFGEAADFVKGHWRAIVLVSTAGLGALYIATQDQWGKISKVTNDDSAMIRDTINRHLTEAYQATDSLSGRIRDAINGHLIEARDGADRIGGNIRDWINGHLSEAFHGTDKNSTGIRDSINNNLSQAADGSNSFSGRIRDGINGALQSAYDFTTRISGNMRDNILGALEAIWHGADRVGGFIRDAINGPIQAIATFGFNHIVVPVAHGIGDLIHDSGLQGVHPISMALGGVVPGRHSRDDVPIFATPGEVMVPRGTVAAFGGPGALMSMLGFSGGGGAGGHYGLGGLIGSGLNAVGNAASSVAHLAGSLVGDLAHLVRGGIEATVGPLFDSGAALMDQAIGAAGFGPTASRLGHTFLDAFRNWIKGQDTRDNAAMAASYGGAAGVSGGGAEQWRSLVIQALLMNGLGPEYANGVLSLINSESGGNPNAINLTDSNAAAGHPSRGLMQTIPGTFEAYRSFGLPDNIVDPLANVYAGIHYALQNYGPGMLMAGGRHSLGGGYLGYEMGTSYVPRDGLAYLHQGEGVLTKRENAAGRGGPTVNMSGQFFSYDPTQLAEAQERKLRDAMALEGLSR